MLGRVDGEILLSDGLGTVSRKGHSPAELQLCTCAAHDEKLGNGALKRGKLKGESSQGKSRNAESRKLKSEGRREDGKQ